MLNDWMQTLSRHPKKREMFFVLLNLKIKTACLQLHGLFYFSEAVISNYSESAMQYYNVCSKMQESRSWRTGNSESDLEKNGRRKK